MMLKSENIAVMGVFIESLFKERKNDIRLTKINLCGKCLTYLVAVFSLLSWLELGIDRRGDCFHGDGRAWVGHCDSPGAAGGCVRTPWLSFPSSGVIYINKSICSLDQSSSVLNHSNNMHIYPCILSVCMRVFKYIMHFILANTVWSDIIVLITAAYPRAKGQKVFFRYKELCYAMLCYVMLRYATLRYATLRYAMLCYVMLCYVMLWAPDNTLNIYLGLFSVTLCPVPRYRYLYFKNNYTKCRADVGIILLYSYM